MLTPRQSSHRVPPLAYGSAELGGRPCGSLSSFDESNIPMLQFSPSDSVIQRGKLSHGHVGSSGVTGWWGRDEFRPPRAPDSSVDLQVD